MPQAAQPLSLETILAATRNNMQQLLRALKNESELLKKNNIEALESITQKKLLLTEQIENSEKQRVHFLTQHQLDPDEPQQWLKNSTLNSIWQEIKTDSAACQKQNQINGLVINNNRNKIQAQLDILNATPAVELVYSSSGTSVRQKDSNTLAHV